MSSAPVKTVILLAGRVGADPFADGVSHAILDLPVTAGKEQVLDVWLRRLDEFARALGVPRIRVRIALNRNAIRPRTRPAASHPRVEVEVVRDPSEYRGTAGVAKDLVRDHDPADLVLVATANQVLCEPLADVFAALPPGAEGVSIVPHRGSEHAGAFLLRCARLLDVPDVGFVDLKEQAIPAARGREALRVARRPEGSALPVRTLDDYVRALRVVHGASATASDAFAESWRPVFAIVEPGADIAAGAVLQDCVVLAGGRVEAGAAVHSSVVCDGGVVRRGRSVVDSVVTAAETA